MNPEQKEGVMLLLKNFIGMLLNFRFEGRNFSIESNKYLHNIHKLIDADYTEEFNEIYAIVHSIVKKISELDWNLFINLCQCYLFLYEFEINYEHRFSIQTIYS